MGPGLRSWLQSVGPEQRAEFKELVNKGVKADDPRLIQHIWKMIIPPQPGVRKVVTPYRITLQADHAQQVLKNKVGVFIFTESDNKCIVCQMLSWRTKNLSHSTNI